MTTLVRWDPLREAAAMHTELSRLMNGLFDGGSRQAQQEWIPTVDVWESDTAVHYAFDLPGIPKDSIVIEVENGALSVSASRQRRQEVEGEGFRRLESRSGTFARTVGLPQGVSEDDISATYEHGVLEIRVPKPEQPKPKRVEIASEGEHATIEG
jgi:HSP20 family protein